MILELTNNLLNPRVILQNHLIFNGITQKVYDPNQLAVVIYSGNLA